MVCEMSLTGAQGEGVLFQRKRNPKILYVKIVDESEGNPECCILLH